MKKELETLIQAVRIYSNDIWMEFGIEKCVMLIMNSGKGQMTERTSGEKATCKYLGIL